MHTTVLAFARGESYGCACDVCLYAKGFGLGRGIHKCEMGDLKVNDFVVAALVALAPVLVEGRIFARVR